MLTASILDCNHKAITEEAFIDSVVSVVGHWIQWEAEQVGYPLTTPDQADVIFLVHAGQVDWVTAVGAQLRRYHIQANPDKRRRTPYLITGGPVDASPFTALTIADGLAIGEAYLFIRQLIDLLKQSNDVDDVARFVAAYPHAIERSQLAPYVIDPSAPWMLRDKPDILATPDEYVDWDANVMIRTDDKVIRLVASKGCHLKCKFCATTYRQTYRINPSVEQIETAMDLVTRRQDKLSLITNDVAALPYFEQISRHGQLAFQSLTVKALRDPTVVEAVIRSHMRIVRFGVEGISERVRQAFGKPIPDAELLDLLDLLNQHNMDTHLFFIVGAPYETEDDWRAYKDFHIGLAKRLHHHLCRIKMTAFNPQPPTPLVYFLPGSRYYARFKEFRDWSFRNWRSRHVLFISPRGVKAQIRDLAVSYHVSDKQIAALLQDVETVDLAPTQAHAERMSWEVIGWPLPAATRWHLSRSYMRTMGALGKAVPRALAVDARASSSA